MTAERLNDPNQTQNPESITAQLKDPKNYNFVLKAVASRDESVLISFLDLVNNIGGFENYGQLISAPEFIRSIVKVYRTAKARQLKVKTLTLLNGLLA